MPKSRVQALVQALAEEVGLLFSFELCLQNSSQDTQYTRETDNLLFSFELCVYGRGLYGGVVCIRGTCYFLLNYAKKCGATVVITLLNSCYFLLNYA